MTVILCQRCYTPIGPVKLEYENTLSLYTIGVAYIGSHNMKAMEFSSVWNLNIRRFVKFER